MAKRYIKRKSAVKPITGSIVDTTNIEDKTTNTYSANVIDGLVQRHIMSASLSTDITKTATGSNQYVLVPLDQYSSVGSKLSFENNGIKIGKGVSKIKLDAILNTKEIRAGFNKGLCIYKNSNAIAQTLISDAGTRNYSQIALINKIIDVEENDIIQLYARAVGITENTDITIRGTSAGTSTYMTIEVLE